MVNQFYRQSRSSACVRADGELSGISLITTVVKHPIMRGQYVQATLSDPDEIRQSKSDPQVYLFYRAEEGSRWVCAVTKRLNGEGFLITAYRTSAIKEGVVTWRKP